MQEFLFIANYFLQEILMKVTSTHLIALDRHVKKRWNRMEAMEKMNV